jgi:hypothetical protein
MTEISQMEKDLRYVRQAVDRRGRAVRGPFAVYYMWAVYVLIGYTLIDVAPRASGWFFLIGGLLGGIGSMILGRRHSRQTGEYDRDFARRAMLHWLGIVLAIASALALAVVVPELRGPHVGQLIVVMIGLVYFLAGVHFDPNFLWLGPVLIAGGLAVGFVPRFGWTALGAVIAAGLVIPTLFPTRPASDVVPTKAAA